MASLVNALDLVNQLSLGEKDHPELAWSSQDMEEKITQFYFQCVRCDENGMNDLGNILDEMLSDDKLNNEQLLALYKLIAQTRDIQGGKGEYSLSYMMIWKWYSYYPELAKFALRCFVKNVDHGYGSWKDIKYMCNYVRDHLNKTEDPVAHPLVQYAIELINQQLREDYVVYLQIPKGSISLAARWVARESSRKFGWLNEHLATHYFAHFLATANTVESIERAIKKCKAQYRMLVVTLNRHLDTVQIKQTGGKWSEIDHAKTTSITMQRQRKAFLNVNHSSRTEEDPDRVQCADNLRDYLENLEKSGKEVKGSKVGLEKFAADARKLNFQRASLSINDEKRILNSQWRDNSAKNGALGNFIAMVDMSGSMEGDPMNAAISLGCRVAEKSALGKRVLTFSSSPRWVVMDDCETYTDMVNAITKESLHAGTSTNFYAAMDMILRTIEENRIPREDAEDMVLAIFSDMQIDAQLCMQNGGQAIFETNASFFADKEARFDDREHWKTMYTSIQEKYNETGIRLYGVPLNPPHILFWNLRKTDGFPVLSTQDNVSMMSGYDSGILNLFCEQGLSALNSSSGRSILQRILENPRYLPMETAFLESRR